MDTPKPLYEVLFIPIQFTDEVFQRGQSDIDVVHERDQSLLAYVGAPTREHSRERGEADDTTALQNGTHGTADLSRIPLFGEMDQLRRCLLTILTHPMLQWPEFVESTPMTCGSSTVLFPLSFSASDFKKHDESRLSHVHQTIRRRLLYEAWPVCESPQDRQHRTDRDT
jgi:hypothetical protein